MPIRGNVAGFPPYC